MHSLIWLFELYICIPAGRKAGKFLAKIMGEEPKFLSDLVKGLDSRYVYGVVSSRNEAAVALQQCHSCQSDNSSQYWNVWTQIGCTMLAMYDTVTNTYVARCLVNFKTGTYAPTYGPCHYLLEARLQFAGFEEGMLVEQSEIEAALTLKQEGLKVKYPKSRVVTKTFVSIQERLDDLLPTLARLTARLNVLRERFKSNSSVSETDYYRTKGPGTYNQFMDQNWSMIGQELELERSIKKLKEMGYADGFGSPAYSITPTQIRIPIKQDWDYVSEDTVVEQKASKLYNDNTREFVVSSIVKTQGWHKKPQPPKPQTATGRSFDNYVIEEGPYSADLRQLTYALWSRGHVVPNRPMPLVVSPTRVGVTLVVDSIVMSPEFLESLMADSFFSGWTELIALIE